MTSINSQAPQIIECIPNFSEGRRPHIVQQIVQAIAAVPGTTILNYSLDPDHNRSVLTFIAPPATVIQAAWAGIAQASELIDMTHHQGQHPRIGATDVCPFVPLRGVTSTECISLATQLAQRVGTELAIPVYLYGQAARHPERTELAHIRRGQYEKLRQTIATDPTRTPDFGPSRLGPAGAIAIGVRNILIAFNIYLTTDNLEIAQKISRSVRHSNGGLRYLKAIGLQVKGKAQVSLNLTDYKRTPLPQVVELIRREATRYGVGIESTELIGLIPQAALIDAARWYLQLDHFNLAQILETHLNQI